MYADLDNTKVILIATGNGIYKKGKMTFAVKFLSLALYNSSKEESLWGELYIERLVNVGMKYHI